ncbi:MAG: S-adenosylmethionine decarboxylase family protein [Micromonosporaceae bacterium]
MRSDAVPKREHRSRPQPAATPDQFGTELVLDLYDCDPDTIRSRDRLTAYVRELCAVIEMTPYGEPFAERFGLGDAKTAGYSVVQLIETSCISGHFSELWNSAYLNVFSCKPFDADAATAFSQEYFGAATVRRRVLQR